MYDLFLLMYRFVYVYIFVKVFVLILCDDDDLFFMAKWAIFVLCQLIPLYIYIYIYIYVYRCRSEFDLIISETRNMFFLDVRICFDCGLLDF